MSSLSLIRIHFVFVSIVALGGVTVAQQSVTFKLKTPAVGYEISESDLSDLQQTLTISKDGKVIQTVEQKILTNLVTKLSVLETKGKEITKIKVVCSKHEIKQKIPGLEAPKNVLNGKTLLIEKKDDKKIVTDASGDSVSKDVAKIALEKFGETVGPYENKFYEILPKRPVKIGETIQLDKKMAEKFFNEGSKSKEKMVVKKFDIKLKSIKEENSSKIAVFDCNFVLVTGAQMEMMMDMKGICHIEVETSRLRLFDVKGDVAMKGGAEQLKIKGKGKMTSGTVREQPTQVQENKS